MHACVCSKPYPVVTGCNIEDRKKGQPNYTGGVHGESNKFGLIEVLRALPGLKGIPSGEENHIFKLTKYPFHFSSS